MYYIITLHIVLYLKIINNPHRLHLTLMNTSIQWLHYIGSNITNHHSPLSPMYSWKSMLPSLLVSFSSRVCSRMTGSMSGCSSGWENARNSSSSSLPSMFLSAALNSWRSSRSSYGYNGSVNKTDRHTECVCMCPLDLKVQTHKERLPSQRLLLLVGEHKGSWFIYEQVTGYNINIMSLIGVTHIYKL